MQTGRRTTETAKGPLWVNLPVRFRKSSMHRAEVLLEQ